MQGFPDSSAILRSLGERGKKRRKMETRRVDFVDMLPRDSTSCGYSVTEGPNGRNLVNAVFQMMKFTHTRMKPVVSFI